MPALGDEALQPLVEPASGIRGKPRAFFEQRGDGVVFADEGAAQHFGGMGGEHQFHPHLRQRLGVHDLGPHRVAGRLALIGDVGEIQKLVEGADEIRQVVAGQSRQTIVENLPILGGAAPRPLGQGANDLDAGHEVVAAVVGDDMPEQAAEQTHIVA